MLNPFKSEEYLSWKDKQPNHMRINGNVIAMLKHEDGRETLHFGHNIITTSGLNFYAAQVAPTLNLGSVPDYYAGTARMELQNPTTTPTPAADDNYGDFSNAISGSRQAVVSESNNQDTLNTHRGLYTITWKGELNI